MPKRSIAAALLAASLSFAAQAQEAREARGPGFDFYVLSLSWSPSYCAAEGEDANRQQCGAARPYAFIVHGLWPQFERGHPEFCGAGEDRGVPRALAESLSDLMPSRGLVRHQWTKHGTCSGLTQRAYFAALRKARERIAVPERFRRLERPLRVDPDTVEADFLEANPSLRADGIAVTCDRRYLREVRICLTKELGFRSCPQIDRRACRSGSISMPPTRPRGRS